jgi:hypothetical protein
MLIQATNYIRGFGAHQLRPQQQTTSQNFFRPIAVGAAVNESGYDDRRIDDDTQRRSAFLPSSICLAWVTTRQTDGFLEAINGLFQAAKRKARGYVRFRTIRTVIFLIAGKLDFSRINPYVPQLT